MSNNLVEKNYNINEIVDILKQIYPALEFTYLTQNMNMRSLIISPDNRTKVICKNNNNDLSAALLRFKKEFSF